MGGGGRALGRAELTQGPGGLLSGLNKCFVKEPGIRGPATATQRAGPS